MTCNVDSIYLHAKISALRSALYDADAYRALIQAGHAHRAFPDCVSEQEARNVDDARQRVFACQIRPVLRMLAVSECYRRLFLAFVRLFETETLKQVCVRAYGRSGYGGRGLDISPYQSFPADLLQRDIDRDALAPLLGSSYLQAAVAPGLPRSFETLENRLDLCMAQEFWRAGDDASRGRRRRFQQILAVRLYLQQCSWVDRLRHCYAWTDAQIAQHLLDALPHQLSCLAPAIAAARRAVPLSVARPAQTQAQVAEAEYLRECWFSGYLRWHARHTAEPLVNAVCYLWLLYYQVCNLFRILEGFRFRLSPDAIAARLVCEA